MNDLLDIEKVCNNPEKYGFERIDVTYKGNSIVINSEIKAVLITNYHFIEDGYLEEGISLIIPTDNDLKITIELKR